MGLFGFRQSADDKRAEEVRTGTRAPDRSERRRCWEARDAYFRCLDGAGIIDSLKEDKAAARACPSEGAVFERDCAAQWVGLVPSSFPSSFAPGDACSSEILSARSCFARKGADMLTGALAPVQQQVTHFKKYRLANYQKEQRIKALEAQGANRVEIDSGPGTTMPAPKRS